MRTAKRWLPAISMLLIVSMVAAGCGSPAGTSAQSAGSTEAKTAVAVGTGAVAEAAETVTVSMKNFAFDSDSITIPPGTRVVFVNEDPTPHNVVEGTKAQVGSNDHQPLFESPELAPGESWEIVFNEEGDYHYACTVAGHYLMDMVGTIHVVEGAEVSIASADEAESEDHAHMHGPAVMELEEGYLPTPEGLAVLEPFRVEGNVKEFAIDVQEVTHELVDGVTVTAWAFNGLVPGPVIRVQEGDLVRVHFTNTHHQPHTIHWHGIYADQKYDGVPHTSQAVMPGETYVYEFVAENAGTFFYHCHVDSYRHVDMGMYGGLIIEPKDETEKTWDHEYTLILDDWDSNVDPMATRYSPNYNYFLINGKAFPDFPTLPLYVGETTRVRLINAGYNNFAMHNHGPNFQVVASDGHELPLPYRKDTVDIAPGERYDIEITPTKAGQYPFHAHNLQYVLNDGYYPGGIHMMFDIRERE